MAWAWSADKAAALGAVAAALYYWYLADRPDLVESWAATVAASFDPADPADPADTVDPADAAHSDPPASASPTSTSSERFMISPFLRVDFVSERESRVPLSRSMTRRWVFD